MVFTTVKETKLQKYHFDIYQKPNKLTKHKGEARNWKVGQTYN
jgi:hypothetical protein